jgi:cell division protein FtsN
VNSLAGTTPAAGASAEFSLAEAGLPSDFNPELETALTPAEIPAPSTALALGTPPTPVEPGVDTPVDTTAVLTEISPPTPTPPKAPTPGALIALEPTTPKPPPETTPSGATPAQTPAQAPIASTRPPTVFTTPPTGSPVVYYLQLGAYRDEMQAHDKLTQIPREYPVKLVSPDTLGGNYYRILLGPLNKAESGTLLYWFRVRGFPDAFVKQSQ